MHYKHVLIVLYATCKVLSVYQINQLDILRAALLLLQNKDGREAGMLPGHSLDKNKMVRDCMRHSSSCSASKERHETKRHNGTPESRTSAEKQIQLLDNGRASRIA